jgi:Asp/Glu/hydantoin racemase
MAFAPVTKGSMCFARPFRIRQARQPAAAPGTPGGIDPDAVCPDASFPFTAGNRMSTIATGGKAIYGAPLGILMLDARFPRIPGDMGNAATWPFPVLYRVVRGATPERVVLRGAAGLLPDFLAGAAKLVADGAEAITTNCGFLSLFQRELAAHVRVPVATSALIQVPWVQATLPPGKRVGVIAVTAGSLTPAHLAAAGVPEDTPIVGTEHGREFFRVLILAEKQDLDIELAARDILDAGQELLRGHLEVGAIVLECTNMPPYARALREMLRVPVYDIYSLVTWFHAALRPRDFSAVRAV